MSGSKAIAQTNRTIIQNQYFSDTLGIGKTTYETHAEESDLFYDRLKNREYKSNFTRAIANLLVRSRDASDYRTPSPNLEVSRAYFEGFAGRTITDIQIVQANIFTRDSADQLSWTENFLDRVHIRTRERVVRKNLLFEVGDKLDPYTMAINEELMRGKDFFATAYFIILPYPGKPDEISVNIFVRDNWSISTNLALGSYPRWEVFDRNFLGSGNRLSLIYYPRKEYQEHGGEINYAINNLFGTFTDLTMRAGIGQTNNAAHIVAHKPFILPSDNIWGLTVGYVQENNGIASFDTTEIINRLEYGLWVGHSWNLSRRKGTTLYIMAAGEYLRFNKRPIVREMLNPYYFNKQTVLTGIGLSRQNFFQGNMIYGFGRTEDIPYGFKFELVSGFQWNEFFSKRYYLGGKVNWGDLTRLGYVEAGVGAGTFFTENGHMQQTALNTTLRYFSPLMRIGTMYLRQFLNVSGTWGFNRLTGEREMLQFNTYSGIRGMGRDLTLMGYNRFVLSGESVFFSPIFFYHFRFAFFTWGDVGWLGYKSNVFSNRLASAAGVGVRIKNERLIFRNIQIRFGFVIRKVEGVRYNPLQISNEETFLIRNFAPDVPSIVSYD